MEMPDDCGRKEKHVSSNDRGVYLQLDHRMFAIDRIQRSYWWRRSSDPTEESSWTETEELENAQGVAAKPVEKREENQTEERIGNETNDRHDRGRQTNV